MFGIPPYGGSIQQPVYYADTDLCNVNEINPKGGYPQRTDGSAWKPPFILLVDRGGCSFVIKVRHAQKAGASAVLIADDTCLCSHDNCELGDNEQCEIVEPLMADDGSGSDVSIPSFLLFKEDADEIKDVLQRNQHVRAQMSFKVPAPDARVEYQLWTDPSDVVSRALEQTFGLAASALGDRASFKPHPYIYDGILAGCQSELTMGNDCGNLCVNSGRYCAMDPDDDMNLGSSGADVVQEALRRLCIWQTYGQDGIGQAWWDYVAAFIDSCPTDEIPPEGQPIRLKFNDPDCVAFSMVTAQIDENRINKCMETSGPLSENATVANTLLDQELLDQRAAGVVLIPSLVVNQAVIHGSLSFATVLKAVCSGFAPGSEPAVCLTCADCGDELDCVEYGSCRVMVNGQAVSDNALSGNVPIHVFGTVLAAFVLLFVAIFVIQSRRHNAMLQHQVRGIVAEYMPVTSQNTRTGDTSLGGIPDHPDDDNDDHDPTNGVHSSSFSIT